MNKNKLVLNHCPNFYKIINFEFSEGDYITEKLINYYEEYIFNVDLTNEENIKIVKQVDQIMAKYIEDYSFRKEMQEELKRIRISSAENYLQVIFKNVLKIFDLWQTQTLRKIYVTRWI